jgi:hypothetical protein
VETTAEASQQGSSLITPWKRGLAHIVLNFLVGELTPMLAPLLKTLGVRQPKRMCISAPTADP